MSKLTDFITNIATDSALQTAFGANPEATLVAQGLTPAEVSAVLSGDKTAVENLAGIATTPVTYYFPAE